MPTRNVVVTGQQEIFVAKLVENGRYQNASEILRKGLRLLEDLLSWTIEHFGIDRERLDAHGVGPLVRTFSNTSEAVRDKKRHVELVAKRTDGL